ncbi:unnamed protein product [Durusdinium trenchii]|uniref:S1 motif domain-containing protein n=2 Tax=Durusdinium trenchii TaxID=1381693 RepID=A0ABP0RWC3_9DINO
MSQVVDDTVRRLPPRFPRRRLLLQWKVLLLVSLLATWMRFSAFAALKGIDKAPAKGPFHEKGQVLPGYVKAVLDNGIVIRTKDGLDGFAHIAELSDSYVDHPAELFTEKDQVSARVLRHEEDLLWLSLKEVGTKKLQEFKINEEVNGTVTAVCQAGADINVGAEEPAFLHVSSIQDNFLMDARERLQKGDKVKVWVTRIDYKGMKVTMRETQREQKTIAKGLKLSNLIPGEELGGEVTGVKPFGAFVNVGAEQDGLMKVRNINNGLVKDLAQLLKKGDKVVVKVRGFVRQKLELELAETLPRLPPVDGFLGLEDQPLDAKVFRQISPTSFLVEVPLPGSTAAPVIAYMKDEWSQQMDLKEGDMVTIQVTYVDVPKRQLSVEREAPQVQKRRR